MRLKRKIWLAQEVAPPKVAIRLPVAKTFHTRRSALVERLLPRQTGGFMTDFNNSILCSRPNRAVKDILKNSGYFLECMAILNFSVYRGLA